MLTLSRRKPTPVDPELQRIDDWYQCFVTGHESRLRDAGLDAETFDREFAAIQLLAKNVTDKLRADYLAWTRRYDH